MEGSLSWVTARGLYSQEPPPPRTRLENNPTLLVSWWCTVFGLAFIVVRVCGRYVRTERFFPEDKVMMLSVIPLLSRMAFVHVVMLWGTNNTQTAGLSPEDIRHREFGSKLVLVARIFFAVFIWSQKLTVALFLKRVAGMIWRRSVAYFLRFIYWFLGLTLLAIVIATLAECQPFTHAWQVVPDPGPHCRLGYANLLTMGTFDAITDLLLVAFPIPLVITTHMRLKRKLFLVFLFGLSLILVAVTCFRVPNVIFRDGSQQFRTLWASLEILIATAVSNALVIGSFIRDKGVKKPKFKKAVGSASLSESLDHSTIRRNTVTHHQWGSDSDLAADMGIRLDPELYSDRKMPRPAPMALTYRPFGARTGTVDQQWSFNKRHSGGTDDDGTSATDSLDVKVSPHEYIETNKTPRKAPGDAVLLTPRRISIFDVGGLLDAEPSSEIKTSDSHGRSQPRSVTSDASSPPSSTDLDSHQQQSPYRPGSRALLHDVGGLLAPPTAHTRAPSPPAPREPPQQQHQPQPPRTGNFSRPQLHPSYTCPAYVPLISTSGSRSTSTSEAGIPPYTALSDVAGGIVRDDDDAAMELQDVGGLLTKRSNS